MSDTARPSPQRENPRVITVNIPAVSYAIGAVAFLILSLLLLTAWRGRLQGGCWSPPRR